MMYLAEAKENNYYTLVGTFSDYDDAVNAAGKDGRVTFVTHGTDDHPIHEPEHYDWFVTVFLAQDGGKIDSRPLRFEWHRVAEIARFADLAQSHPAYYSTTVHAIRKIGFDTHAGPFDYVYSSWQEFTSYLRMRGIK